MTLTRQQLETVTRRAFPGDALRDTNAQGPDRYGLRLASGERLTLRRYATAAEAATAAAALRLLAAEIDLPVPQLRAEDSAGETIGVPYLLLSAIEGEPLDAALPRMTESQRYEIGQRLGALARRVHRLRAGRYGALAGEEPAAADERGYVLERLASDLERAEVGGLLDRQTAGQVRSWFTEQFKPAGREPALLHGALGPRSILLRRAESGWRIAALDGWGAALGWAPAWEHTVFLAATEGAQSFSLRVGYGNGYDAQVERVYEQVREPVLAPYRALLALRQMIDARDAGDFVASDRARQVLATMLRLLAGE